ncbi:MAG: YkgJ family cysteine cluster protein [Bdellovibrionaceae bacterium]|nr:YkgJ family cysteine cluster protein [Pseudobdellovibrionaceae bacterium]
MSKTWWKDGIRFQCQSSGNCCVSRGEFGFVYLTLKDRQRLAKHLQMTTAAFTRRFCEKTGGLWHLQESKSRPECLFLRERKCSVYPARPEQCRTWPFWPEVLKPKAWKKEVVGFCPGVGKGPLISAQEIEATLEADKKWRKELGVIPSD